MEGRIIQISIGCFPGIAWERRPRGLRPGDFVPHVRLMDEGFSKPETAKQFGLPYVVVRRVRPYDTATLNYNWQVWETQAFSLYTTTTARIDPNSAGQAVLAVMNFLSGQGRR